MCSHGAIATTNFYHNYWIAWDLVSFSKSHCVNTNIKSDTTLLLLSHSLNSSLKASSRGATTTDASNALHCSPMGLFTWRDRDKNFISEWAAWILKSVHTRNSFVEVVVSPCVWAFRWSCMVYNFSNKSFEKQCFLPLTPSIQSFRTSGGL